MITFSCYSLSLPLSSSLFSSSPLFFYSQYSFTSAIKKTEPGRRTNEYRKALCLLLSSHSIISHNYAPVMFSRRNIHGLQRHVYICAFLSRFFSPISSSGSW
jgi:hypothetical protein